MDKPQSPGKEPQVRFLIACPRSGSTLLMRIFAESPDCAVTSRLILMGNGALGEAFRPDYSILENPYHHKVFVEAMNLAKRFLIIKEELGNKSQKGECLYDVCPTPSAYAKTRPVFWSAIPSGFSTAGTPSHAISCFVYERLIREPRTELERICARWGVPFSESMLESMLDFEKPFGSSFVFSTDRERAIYCEEKPLGLFTTVEASSSIITDVPPHGLHSNGEKDNLVERVGRLYLRCWRDDVLRLRAILAEKTWIGCDLDDTLHEFRRASSKATDKVLAEMSEQYGTPMPALREEYSKVLRAKTADAFADGKTSFDYRKERFRSVLEHFSLPRDAQFMAGLLESYEATLVASFELKCGALGLLSTIKNMGKKIVVITEGPQDAQERTVDALGIGGCIDFLATTNHFRVAKTDGMFAKVLQHLGISSGDMAYVGDNEQRDIRPAMAEGIFIHLSEAKHVSLNSVPPQINTLRKLQYILSG